MRHLNELFDYSLLFKLNIHSLFRERLKRCGYIGFYFIALVIVCDYILIQVLEFFNPAKEIDMASDCSDFGRQNKLKNI